MENQSNFNLKQDDRKSNLIGLPMLLPCQLPSPALPVVDHRRYVSVFRIDGFPILPPLMTLEKRREMQKYKELAINIEQKRNKHVAGQQKSDGLNNNNNKSEIDLNSFNENLTVNVEQELQETYLLHSNMIKKAKQEEIKKQQEVKTQTLADQQQLSNSVDEKISDSVLDNYFTDRIHRLKNSDVLYDNQANSNVSSKSSYVVLQNQEVNKSLKQDKLNAGNNKTELIDLEKLNTSEKSFRQKPKSLIVDKLTKPIPSICVNPPTPLIEHSKLNDKFSSANSNIEDITNTIVADENISYCSKVNPNQGLKKQTAKQCQQQQNVLVSEVSQQPLIKRSSTSPSLNQYKMSTPNKNAAKKLTDNESLVRSNSFTLDFPSRALIDHMRQQNTPITTKRKSPSTSVKRDTIESKAKRVQKVETKTKSRTCAWRAPSKNMCSTPVNNLTSTTSLYIRSKRICSEPRPSSKQLRQVKTSNSSSSSMTSIQGKVKSLNAAFEKAANIKTSASSKNITPSPPEKLLDLTNIEIINGNQMIDLESEHRKRLFQLINQQQAEQKRLHETFEKQQKLLIEQLTVELKKARIQAHNQNAVYDNSGENSSTSMESQNINKTIEDKDFGCADFNRQQLLMDYDEATSQSPSATIIISPASSVADLTSFSTLQLDSNTTDCCTPRNQMAFAREHSPLIYSVRCNSNSSPSARRLLQPDSERRLTAANIINAYVRGYLVRRLFKTDQIQRIVETIRETMCFIINLHIEEKTNDQINNNNNDVAANVRLKARMLQQLSSASRTLHLVFFQTTVKERMDIISRDRKRIKTKMLSSNLVRSPRVIQSF